MKRRSLSAITLAALVASVRFSGLAAQSDPSEIPATPTAPAASPDAVAEKPHKPVPYEKLADALATPELLSSDGPKDKSLLRLRFVGSGETEKTWLKMTSINIAKVKAGDTETAARSIIAKFKTSLEAQKHAKIVTFDESPVAPTHAFFAFSTTDGVAEQGVAYSPADGFVSVIQVAYKHGFVHGATDRDFLKSVIAPK